MSGLPNIPSPCVGICTLDPVSGNCLGCLRSRSEIAEWPVATNERRFEIVTALRERRRAMGITSPADSRPRRRQRR